MRRRDAVIYPLVGLGAWLNGAIGFRLGGRALFESGALVTALVAFVIAVLVCAVFRGTMAWRKADPSQAVTIAVAMALPGLFAETARQCVFTTATGLSPDAAPGFSAVIFFGNAVLLTYALIVASADRRSAVDDDDRPGHVGGGVAEHEDGRGGQFFGPTETLHRHALRDDRFAPGYAADPSL
jgi:hypothetical protein